MNQYPRLMMRGVIVRRLTVVPLGILFAVTLFAQKVPESPKPVSEKTTDEIIVLSPFSVNSSEDRGYGAATTIGATRVNTEIKNTPLSVAVLTQQLIQDTAARDPFDVAKYVSGVSGAGAPGSGQMTVRGQNVPGATFRDGFAEPNSLQGAILIDLAVVDRVEVIKGPAGTLYGAHNAGGIVNYVTKRPDRRGFTNLTAFIDADAQRAELDTTGSTNVLTNGAYRMVVAQQFGHNTYGAVEKATVLAPTLTFDLGGWAVTTRYIYSHQERGTNAYSWFTDKDGKISTFVSRTNPIPDKDTGRDYTYHTADIVLERSGKIGPIDWTARVTGRYNEAAGDIILYEQGRNLYGFFDAQGNLLGNMDTVSFSDPRFDHVELSARTRSFRRSDAKSGGLIADWVGDFEIAGTKHKLLVYGQYGEGKSHDLGYAANYPGINLKAPVYNSIPAAIQSVPAKNIDSAGWSDSQAFGLQDNVSVLKDKVILVAGTRYDKSTGNSINRINGLRINDDVRSAWSNKLGAVIRPVAPLGIFYNYSETFAPNGFDGLTGNRLPNLDATTNEIGVKLDLFHGDLSVTASHFDTEIANYVIGVTVVDAAGATRIVNQPVGKQTVKGWEADLTYSLNENIAFIGGIGDLSSKTQTGLRARAVPQGLNWKGFIKYTITSGKLQGSYLGFGYISNNDRALDGADTATLPGYEVADALIGYRNKRWNLQVNVSNVFDEKYGAIAVAKQIVYAGTPRKCSLTVRYRF